MAGPNGRSLAVPGTCTRNVLGGTGRRPPAPAPPPPPRARTPIVTATLGGVPGRAPRQRLGCGHSSIGPCLHTCLPPKLYRCAPAYPAASVPAPASPRCSGPSLCFSPPGLARVAPSPPPSPPPPGPPMPLTRWRGPPWEQARKNFHQLLGAAPYPARAQPAAFPLPAPPWRRPPAVVSQLLGAARPRPRGAFATRCTSAGRPPSPVAPPLSPAGLRRPCLAPLPPRSAGPGRRGGGLGAHRAGGVRGAQAPGAVSKGAEHAHLLLLPISEPTVTSTHT
jgi:hypothetical protein